MEHTRQVEVFDYIVTSQNGSVMQLNRTRTYWHAGREYAQRASRVALSNSSIDSSSHSADVQYVLKNFHDQLLPAVLFNRDHIFEGIQKKTTVLLVLLATFVPVGLLITLLVFSCMVCGSISCPCSRCCANNRTLPTDTVRLFHLCYESSEIASTFCSCFCSSRESTSSVWQLLLPAIRPRLTIIMDRNSGSTVRTTTARRLLLTW